MTRYSARVEDIGGKPVAVYTYDDKGTMVFYEDAMAMQDQYRAMMDAQNIMLEEWRQLARAFQAVAKRYEERARACSVKRLPAVTAFVEACDAL